MQISFGGITEEEQSDSTSEVTLTEACYTRPGSGEGQLRTVEDNQDGEVGPDTQDLLPKDEEHFTTSDGIVSSDHMDTEPASSMETNTDLQQDSAQNELIQERKDNVVLIKL